MVQFKSILCPVDFFKASSRAVDYSFKLAESYEARVHLIHVVAPAIAMPYGAPIGSTDFTVDLEKESERLLRKLKDRGERARIDVTTEVRLGDVDLGILHAVKAWKADLVVMGTHGRRGFERLVLGSVTERMVRHCPVPLLTIGASGKTSSAGPKIRRILVTTDFSDGTAEAVGHALSIGQRYRAKVTLLHVLHDAAVDALFKYRDSLVLGIEAELQKLIPERALDLCDVETQVKDGVPGTVIPDLVKSGAFDLLVMNIHGKSLLDRALIGSTAERTLRAAAGICPVLLIPPAKASRKSRKPLSPRRGPR